MLESSDVMVMSVYLIVNCSHCIAAGSVNAALRGKGRQSAWIKPAAHIQEHGCNQGGDRNRYDCCPLFDLDILI